MDIDTGSFQAGLLGSFHAYASPKVNNVQLSSGLIRYHSAPSSVLAGLLDDDFFPASEDSDFARLLNDGIGSFSSLLEQKGTQQGDSAQAVSPKVVNREDAPHLTHGSTQDRHPQYMGTGSTFQEQLSQISLSVISEYGVEESVDNFCSSSLPLSTDVTQQAPHQLNPVNGVALKSGLASSPHGISFDTGLIRQSSSSADILPRLVMEDNSEKAKMGCGQCLTGTETGQRSLAPSQVAALSNFTDVKCSSMANTVPSPRISTALLRQSSSPAGLLSQINLDDFSMVQEKGLLATTSEIFPSQMSVNRRGSSFTRSLNTGGWDDGSAELTMQHVAALGQRKRGRVFEGKPLKGSEIATTDLSSPTMSNFSPPSSSLQTSIDSIEASTEDSVLCKARAKRGCATHPRSIAERQRRIKISERMKKLQDLVPNLDKQANTAEMLDEVVEYVKLLQRQVQELSINRPPCNGMCQQGGNSPE